MQANLVIRALCDHPECIPTLREWFEHEWPDYYGVGRRGNAEADLRAFARGDALPIGVVAFLNGKLCGVAALKATSIDSRAHLTPWASAGLVPVPYRRRGIGAKLLAAVEDIATGLSFDRIYCATSTSSSLLERSGWSLAEHVPHEGTVLALYEKAL